jgi:carboxymethylenebutenolidase
MKERVESIFVDDGSTMGAFVASPSGAGPHPAMVVIAGAGGVDAGVTEITRRLATAGYYAVAPDMFHRLDPREWDGETTRAPKLTDTWIISDVNAALAHIQSQSTVRTDRIGIMGFCMGGRVSLMIAAVNPAFKASVPFYPGNSLAPRPDGPSAFDRLKDVSCPILGFFGTEDQNPSPEDMQKLDEELTRLGKPHTFHSMPGAGHAFMSFDNPQTYRVSAEMAAWPLALAFLQERLAG